MLDTLDSTLESLLKRNLPPDFPSRDGSVSISFDTPYQGAIKSKPAINFFLYEVQENLELRSSAWSVERQNTGKAVKKRPPARVDCSYLITAWPQNEDDVRTEHLLLGEVMRILLNYRKIPEDCVADDFEGQETPLRLISLRPSNLKSFGEFWQAMGGKEGTRPKVVLHCTVTISVPLNGGGEEVGLVGVNQFPSQ
jgi:Pvc16 N-terminal domain